MILLIVNNKLLGLNLVKLYYLIINIIPQIVFIFLHPKLSSSNNKQIRSTLISISKKTCLSFDRSINYQNALIQISNFTLEQH